MRHLLLSLTLLLSSVCASAGSYDEQIAGAMNTSDWFALDSIYRSAPKDSIMPFLEIFSRCMIGNRLNRPDVSVPAFEELFSTQTDQLDLSNLLNSSMMFAMDLSRTGENAQAAGLLKSILESTHEHLDTAWLDALGKEIGRYTALSAYNPYSIDFADSQGRIPFRIVPVGTKKHDSMLMHLEESTINGIDADITFDTGAGVNIISDSLASRYGLIPLDAVNTVMGLGKRDGRYVIAKELKLGDITVADVPFLIVPLTTGHAEADQYIGGFDIVVGSELMLQLKDLTIDFTKREITVPAVAPTRSDATPNLCFSSGMNLLAKGAVHGNPMLMLIDSGDASFGSLGQKFFADNQEYVTTHSRPDTIRGAGIGGVRISECYNLTDLAVNLGGHTLTVPELTVIMADNNNESRCTLGIKSLMRFGRLRFNLVDFTLTTEPADLSAVIQPIRYDRPSFSISTGNDRNWLQTAGFVTLAITRAIFYPDAPVAPDL